MYFYHLNLPGISQRLYFALKFWRKIGKTKPQFSSKSAWRALWCCRTQRHCHHSIRRCRVSFDWKQVIWLLKGTQRGPQKGVFSRTLDWKLISCWDFDAVTLYTVHHPNPISCMYSSKVKALGKKNTSGFQKVFFFIPRCDECMDYLPTWTVKNGHMNQGKSLHYMEHVFSICPYVPKFRWAAADLR